MSEIQHHPIQPPKQTIFKSESKSLIYEESTPKTEIKWMDMEQSPIPLDIGQDIQQEDKNTPDIHRVFQPIPFESKEIVPSSSIFSKEIFQNHDYVNEILQNQQYVNEIPDIAPELSMIQPTDWISQSQIMTPAKTLDITPLVSPSNLESVNQYQVILEEHEFNQENVILEKQQSNQENLEEHANQNQVFFEQQQEVHQESVPHEQHVVNQENVTQEQELSNQNVILEEQQTLKSELQESEREEVKEENLTMMIEKLLEPDSIMQDVTLANTNSIKKKKLISQEIRNVKMPSIFMGVSLLSPLRNTTDQSVTSLAGSLLNIDKIISEETSTGNSNPSLPKDKPLPPSIQTTGLQRNSIAGNF